MDKKLDIDTILEDLNEFGKYQKINYFLLCLVIIFSALPLSYIFTTRSTNYRCLIEECESFNSSYENHWINNTIPFTGNLPQKCHRFAKANNATDENVCLIEENFNRSLEIQCNDFIYEHKHLTIESDFNITCDENLWQLTIIGTINNIGELVGLPLSGIVSDRYGRRTMMIISVLLSAICGLLRSFSFHYYMYVALEVLDTCLGAGTFSAAYILAIELVVPKQRVLGNTLIACAFAVGESILGIAAWISPSWRIMLRILYTPGILFISYYWLTHESVRWLLSKGEYDQATHILKKVAKTNSVTLNVNILTRLTHDADDIKTEHKETFYDVLKVPTLLLRLINCSFVWISSTFIYYGLTMHSVSISGNVYVNFITVAIVELPAYLMSYCTLDKIGRRVSLALSLILSGLASIAFIFVPEVNTTIKLIIFLFGKFSITIAYTTLYIYTTELFPTNLRHSILSICSMFGRLGSMVAPQIPLLNKISTSLPLILFGAMATSSGILTLFNSETLNTKLPDTIDEALHIGKKSDIDNI